MAMALLGNLVADRLDPDSVVQVIGEGAPEVRRQIFDRHGQKGRYPDQKFYQPVQTQLVPGCRFGRSAAG